MKLTFSWWVGQMWASSSSSTCRRGRAFWRRPGEVLGHPGDHGVGDDGQAPCLLGLLLVVTGRTAPSWAWKMFRRRVWMFSPLFSCRAMRRRKVLSTRTRVTNRGCR